MCSQEIHSELSAACSLCDLTADLASTLQSDSLFGNSPEKVDNFLGVTTTCPTGAAPCSIPALATRFLNRFTSSCSLLKGCVHLHHLQPCLELI